MDAPTSGSRSAAALTAALGLCQVWWAVGSDRPSAAAAVMAPLSLVAALALARANCLETRLGAVLVAVAPLTLTVLALSIGLPGESRHPMDAAAALWLVLPLAVLGAIGLDRRQRVRRGSTGGRAPDPYAR